MTPDELKQLQVADGKPGEIIVTGNHVLTKYINNKDAFLRYKIRAGAETWHRTGDMGRMVNGELYLLGTCKDVFEYKGKLHYPFICSYIFKEIAGVNQAAILLHNVSILIGIELKRTMHLENCMKQNRGLVCRMRNLFTCRLYQQIRVITPKLTTRFYAGC